MKQTLAATLIAMGVLALHGQSQIDSIAAAIAGAAPSIRAIRLQASSEAESLRAENMLADPSAEFEHLWGNRQVGNKYTIGVSQELKLPMIYRSRTKLATAIETAADARTRAATQTAQIQARQLLTQIAFDRKIATLQNSVATVTARRVELLDSMLSRGETTRLDLYKAKVERMNAVSEHQSTMRRIAAATQALASIAANPQLSIGPLNLPDVSHAPLPWEAYREQFIPANPYTASMDAERNVASQRISVINADKWPSLSLGYVYNNEMGDSFHGLSVGLTLPVYSRKSRRLAARMASQGALADEESALAQVLSDMKQAHDEARSLWIEIGEWRNLLRGNEDLQLLQRMEQVGRIKRPDALAELASMLTLRINLLNAERDYASALTRLRR